MRYLNLLQSQTIKIEFKDIKVILPEPAAYVLHKFIVFERRKKEEKMIRDLKAAKEIGEFLLKKTSQRKKIKKIFKSLPTKWQKKIVKNIEDKSPSVFDFLNNLDKSS